MWKTLNRSDGAPRDPPSPPQPAYATHDAISQFRPRTDDNDGTTIIVALAGQSGSGTRAVGLVVIISECIEGPTHIGIDNQTCVSNTNQLIKIAGNLPAGTGLDTYEIRKLQRELCSGNLWKPWNIQPNGDIWRLFLECVIAKGSHAVRMPKLKAHSTLEDVANNLITIENLDGNRKSDKAAGSGQTQHGDALLALANWFQQRHLKY